MKNVMMIDNQKAVISYDPDIGMFRGEFIGLNGGADFYAADVAGLMTEGRASLRVYLDVCAEKGIEPYKDFSGKFTLRIGQELHEEIVILAAAEDKSLNEVVVTALKEYVEHDE